MRPHHLLPLLIALLGGWAGAAEPLRLDQAMARALDASPALRAQQLELQRQQAEREIAAAQRLPRVDLAAQAFHAANPTLVAPIRRAGSFPPLDRDVASVELALTLPLVTGGRLDAAEALAGHGRDAAAAGLRVAEQDLLLEVAATYAKALQLRDMQAVARARIAALQAEQLQRQRRFDEGRAARLDLMRLQTQLSQARHDLLVVEQGERDARALLAALLASTDPLPPLVPLLPLPAELMSTPSLPRDADPADPGGAETEADAAVDRAVDHALAQRPELRRAQARVQAADAQRRIAESALAPQLSLVAQASASTGGDLHGYADGRVGVQLAIPIFDGSIRRQRASQAALERDRQSLAAEDLRHRLAAEVRQAHGALRESRARLAVAAQGEREAEEALRIESARLDAGEGTVGDLLAAEAALWAARVARLQAGYDGIVARARTLRAAGELDAQDFAPPARADAQVDPMSASAAVPADAAAAAAADNAAAASAAEPGPVPSAAPAPPRLPATTQDRSS